MQQSHTDIPRPLPDAPVRSIRRSSATYEHANIDAQTIVGMDLATLQRHCRIESERFFRGQPHDTRFAYELFRRALVERCDAAWEYLFHQYRALVESWVRRSSAFSSTGESSEYFVGSVFARFWQAITPERFAAFPTLGSLLHYLHLCASCVVIDCARAQSWAEIVPDERVRTRDQMLDAPDEEAINRVTREEFWRSIDALLMCDAERFVLYHSFIMGRKPGEIYKMRRDLFGSVAEVYNVKRNILGRLSRNRELRRLAGMPASS
ncbi:MAG: sigma-70 family RNA polymerase sigma factor [Roseiflexus sp.]|jgi:RNA polymerase sigma factor, sigma-70 family|nr:sigma-70 family RNA polymerase sigma factor [Roseiflexus sp.]